MSDMKPRAVPLAIGPITRLAALPVAIAAALLGGCREHGLDNVTASTLSNTETRHPIGFSSRTEALYVEVAPDGEGLSGNQATDVLRFIERYKVEGRGRLTIAAPGSARGHVAASRTARQVADIARGAGLPPDAIAEARPAGGGGGRYGPTVRIAYERPVAVAPNCGDWPEDLGESRERLPHASFGCATQRNLAMSVATSRDLATPQEEAPGAGERRTALWSKYVGSAPAGGGSGGGAAPAPMAPAIPKAGGP